MGKKTRSPVVFHRVCYGSRLSLLVEEGIPNKMFYTQHHRPAGAVVFTKTLDVCIKFSMYLSISKGVRSKFVGADSVLLTVRNSEGVKHST